MRRRIRSDLHNGYRIRSFQIGPTGRIESPGHVVERSLITVKYTRMVLYNDKKISGHHILLYTV